MRWRVVCGLRDVIETFAPTSRLSSVDLPTLGRPTIATRPQRKACVPLIVPARPRSLAEAIA